MTEESRTAQDDLFSNPGFLWADKGAEAFQTKINGKSCQSCHDDPDAEFASPLAYPAIDPQTKTLINLEGRINACRTEYQQTDAYPYESEELLSLTTYVQSLSRGKAMAYQVTDALRPHYLSGEDYFYQRRGQLNLSCHQCHDQNSGKKMRGDTVSQGHINGFPAYRNDWQTLGSSHRRFQACNEGVRAQISDLGSAQYLDLEVYLKARGVGLTNETPSIRR